MTDFGAQVAIAGLALAAGIAVAAFAVWAIERVDAYRKSKLED